MFRSVPFRGIDPTHLDMYLRVFVVFVVAITSCVNLTERSPLPKQVFPLFKQCNPNWAENKMGPVNCSKITCPGATFGRDTVCSEGCAMTCISMAMDAFGYKIQGESVNPGILNSWLVENGGYMCLDGNCNNLDLVQIEEIVASGRIKFLGEIFKPNFNASTLVKALALDIVVIAHVRNKTHFVLLDGATDKGESFSVLDPFYNTSIYTYESISDVIMYSMSF